VAVALFLGKKLGVFGAVALAIRMGLSAMPRGASWSQIHGVAAPCGENFTMRLFIGEIDFDGDRGLAAQVSLECWRAPLLRSSRMSRRCSAAA
jgi:Na+/H+ antiporter NhaA